MIRMAFDFKKEYKEFYMPKSKPGIDYSRKEDFRFISVIRHPIRKEA